ncbi:Ff.00g000990.m01.CDS01 [Fusarium sp. VM40]|nr:Ff.00g000990.m01.CDS01 [Fusarium sp. VM40]
MSFRSRELLHYFHDSHDSSDLVLSKASRNIFSSVVQHPDALRDTLLVAGLHYAWTVGDLQTYKSTFLFHKVSTIRMLNGWLQNIQQPGLMTFIRHVSILCFIEASYGNMGDTESHMNGLINAVHLLSPLDDSFSQRSNLEEELANRYLLLTYYAYQGFKARISGSEALKNMFRQNNTATFSTFVSLIHFWKTQNIGHLEMRLNAMKLLPFFFAALPSTAKFHDIDASPLVDCLRHVTTSTQTVKEDRYKCDPSWEWIEGSESRLLCATIGSHFSSMFEDDMSTSLSSSRYRTSWSGMCAASSLYLHSVLDLWNGGSPMEPRLLLRFLSILKRDLDQSIDLLGSNAGQDFWFWRAFLGAYSIAKHQAQSHDPTLNSLQQAFGGFVESWKRATGLALWGEVHDRLSSVAWPTNQGQELGPNVWGSAIEFETSR